MAKQKQVFILTLGVFSIINTEMGVIGILPLIAAQYQIDIAAAGLLVGLFALAVAVSGPVMPLLFSGVDRKKAMLLVLGMFTACNVFSAFAANFTEVLIARVLPAFFHPIYCSLAFTVAASSVGPEKAPQAVSKVMMGVSAGMVLGVPIVSLIADMTSLRTAMLSFAAVNAAAFLATWRFFPSMPVKERLSYGAQVGVLKEPVVWVSIAAVVFLNGATFGVYSYFAAYLESVTKLSIQTASAILLVYGLANIIGNVIAGRLLATHAIRFVRSFPVMLGLLYIVMFFAGQHVWLAAALTLVWGVLAGAGGNINQYWLVSAAPEAPEFSNGLFLSSTNLGTTIGAMLCGALITDLGMGYVFFGGILFSLCGMAAIFLRARDSISAAARETPRELI